MLLCVYLELLKQDPAERQNASMGRRKDGLEHAEHVGEKLLSQLSEPKPFPCSLESGHVTYRVNPRCREVKGGQRMLQLSACNTERKHICNNCR